MNKAFIIDAYAECMAWCRRANNLIMQRANGKIDKREYDKRAIKLFEEGEQNVWRMLISINDDLDDVIKKLKKINK